MQSYERGPWRIETREGGVVRLGTESCPSLILIGGRGQSHAQANGARVRALLNSCEGIPTAELARMAEEWKARPRVFAVKGSSIA